MPWQGVIVTCSKVNQPPFENKPSTKPKGWEIEQKGKITAHKRGSKDCFTLVSWEAAGMYPSKFCLYVYEADEGYTYSV